MHCRTWEVDGQMLPLLPPRITYSSTPCAVLICGSLAHAGGYCKPHYDSHVIRKAPEGRPVKTLRVRVPGETLTTHQGYVLVFSPDHPRVLTNGYVPQHRLAMESMIGRYLRSDESVHHKNGVRHDNRPENLELWARSQPAGQRVSDLVIWAEEILSRYGGHVSRIGGPCAD